MKGQAGDRGGVATSGAQKLIPALWRESWQSVSGTFKVLPPRHPIIPLLGGRSQRSAECGERFLPGDVNAAAVSGRKVGTSPSVQKRGLVYVTSAVSTA